MHDILVHFYWLKDLALFTVYTIIPHYPTTFLAQPELCLLNYAIKIPHPLILI